MRRAITALAISGAILASGSAFAVQLGNGSGPKQKPVAGSSHAPKGPSQGAPKGPGQGKLQGNGGPKTQGPGKSPGAATTKRASQPAGKTSTAKETPVTTTPSPGTTATYSAVQQKLQRNTKLANKLDGRLPAGTDVMAAASGFRNLGQFIAAVNVSNNLGIPFAQLKSRMVDDGMSLGRAIQDLRPSIDYVTEIRRAERDATVLVDEDDSFDGSSTAGAKSKSKAKARKPGSGQ